MARCTGLLAISLVLQGTAVVLRQLPGSMWQGDGGYGAESGPWKKMEQDADKSGRNICMDGVQLPDLYVIGVQKSGTSSLAEALVSAGVRNIHGPINPKEMHLFNAPARLNYTLGMDSDDAIKENRRLMEAWMPACSNKTRDGQLIRAPLADLTPDYHRVVRKPSDSGELAGRWRPIDEMNISVPHAIRQLYGPKMSPKVNFAMMIREPLAQMQSAWYMGESLNFSYCRDCKDTSFRHHLQTVLKAKRLSDELTPWLWTAMYARQLEDWLSEFDASQFYVVPMNEFAKGDHVAICNDLSSRLDFHMGCGKIGASEVAHKWSHEHPPVDEDASEYLRGQFDRLYEPEKKRLVQVLTQAHKKGMGLANYKGATGSEDDVQAWLEKSW
eukprot:TRINITY_DN74663_c0_g1_i1.p1 TRINITY_DN74663_c0_g1~~TRINITY_DN74663_c0_g1_i1.p1  ORF type:complete len:407 (-),score=60.84 TRINITY_DN74663_c0_g1_i1:182-1336(-)